MFKMRMEWLLRIKFNVQHSNGMTPQYQFECSTFKWNDSIVLIWMFNMWMEWLNSMYQFECSTCKLKDSNVLIWMFNMKMEWLLLIWLLCIMHVFKKDNLMLSILTILSQSLGKKPTLWMTLFCSKKTYWMP